VQRTEQMGRKTRTILAHLQGLESQKISAGGRSVFLDFYFYRTSQARSEKFITMQRHWPYSFWIPADYGTFRFQNVTYEFSLLSLEPFRWNEFWWLLKQSFGFLHVWPLLLVTFGLLANLVVALIRRWPFSDKIWKREYWIVFLSLLFIPINIAIGDIGWIDPSISPRPAPNTLLVWTNNGLFIASVALAIFWVYRMKGLRWFALAFALIQLWMMFWAGLVAGMALTGDWL
jgi:hypothetical protein